MKKFILTFIFNTLFDLALRRDNPFTWIAIYLMKSRKCAPAARWLQHKKGGKLVYSVKVKWDDNRISDHFMNLIDDQIIDLNGNRAVMVDKQTIDFGNGQYRIISIAKNWSDFEINGLVDLLEKDCHIHSKIEKEKGAN